MQKSSRTWTDFKRVSSLKRDVYQNQEYLNELIQSLALDCLEL